MIRELCRKNNTDIALSQYIHISAGWSGGACELPGERHCKGHVLNVREISWTCIYPSSYDKPISVLLLALELGSDRVDRSLLTQDNADS